MNKVLLLLLFIPLTFGVTTHKYIPLPPVEVVSHIVTLTTYSTFGVQTDSNPLETASGFKLDSINPKRHRIIAISRDLRSKFKFRDKVRIIGAGIYDGVYRIEDIMNKRFKNMIDVLVNPKDRGTKLYNIKIVKL